MSYEGAQVFFIARSVTRLPLAIEAILCGLSLHVASCCVGLQWFFMVYL